MNDDSNFDLPPARKTPSGDPPSAPFTPGGDPWSAPLSADHVPPSAPYDPASGPWGGGYAAGGTPYGSPMPGHAPPPPPGRGRPGTTSPQQRRRRLAGILFGVLFVGIIGTIAGILLTRPNDGTTTSTPNGPVAVATDKPTATATLKPGQTPLPTRIPTATPIPQPTAAPGQPTPTPLPTATSIPYASHASVTFTRASQPISVSSSITATVGGQIPVTVESASNIPASASETQDETAAQPASYALTVHNNANFQATSSGATIHSTGGIACALQGSLTIAAHATATTTQACITNPGAQPSNVSFNNSADNPPFVYTGGPFPAGGSDEFWTVPSDCATNAQNVSDAQGADQPKIQASLNGQVPTNSNVFSPATYNYSALTCQPAAGTKTVTTSTQSFTVSVTGLGSEASYVPQDAVNYQLNQLTAAASNQNPPKSWGLIHHAICGTPSISSHTTTSASLMCSATGIIAWIWTAGSASSTISPLITGEAKGAALSTVNAVQGVKSGSASIGLTGGSYMPQGSSHISYTIITP